MKIYVKMCIICSKEYDNNTFEINCYECKNVIELPFLSNLQRLYCSNTKITKLPEYPNLKYLWCDNTKITNLPEYPNLEKLYCYNTKITVLPEYPNLKYLWCENTKITDIPKYPKLEYKNIENCVWLEESYKNKEEFRKRINKLIILQRLWKWKKMNHIIPLIKDIKEHCIKVYYL